MRRCERVLVVAHHRATEASRRRPVHPTDVVAGHVLPERLELLADGREHAAMAHATDRILRARRRGSGRAGGRAAATMTSTISDTAPVDAGQPERIERADLQRTEAGDAAPAAGKVVVARRTPGRCAVAGASSARRPCRRASRSPQREAEHGAPVVDLDLDRALVADRDAVRADGAADRRGRCRRSATPPMSRRRGGRGSGRRSTTPRCR